MNPAPPVTRMFFITVCETEARAGSEQESVTGHRDEQNNAYKSIGCEERGIQTRQVIGFHYTMLIRQQDSGRQHTDQTKPSEMRLQEEQHQRRKHQRMDSPCYPQRFVDSEPFWN